MLVAGMLATATLIPVAQAHNVSDAVTMLTVSDAMAYHILGEARGELEAQLQQSLSTDFLYKEYKAGRAQIAYLGDDGLPNGYEVRFGGGVIIILCDEF